MVTSMERVLDPESGSGALVAAQRRALAEGHQWPSTTSPSSSTSTSPSPTSRTWCPSGNYNTAILPRTYKGDIVKNPVGTGPFMLDQYTPKQKATFKKNPTYWGKDERAPAAVPGRHSSTSWSRTTRPQNLQLQSGAIDLQPQTVFQGAQALFADPNLRVDIYPGTGIREVAFNTKEPWNGANGKQLRQAVAYCLDRAAINKALYDGRSNLGYDTFWEPTVFPGSPPAARARPGLREGQAAARRRRLSPTGSRSS